jgi:hypothetical protein
VTNQGARQASVRGASGTALTYEGDWHALFDQAGTPPGAFDGRLLAWINAQLSSSYGELDGAMAAFAQSQGAPSWPQMGAFAVGGGFQHGFLLEDGVSLILLEDGASFLQQET